MRARALQEADREELTRLYRAMFEDADAERDVAQLYAQLPDTSGVFVVDRGDGRLGGFVQAGWRSYAEGCESSPVPFVEAWYVEPDLRRAGWGRALVAAVEDRARARGAVELASDAQLENAVSHAAHRRLGFDEVERIVCYRKPL